MKKLSQFIQKKSAIANNIPLNWDEKSVIYIAQKIFQEEFGKSGERNFSFKKYAKNTLYIKTKNSVWSSELWLNKEKLIQKINKELKKEEIKKIKTIL